MLKLFTKETVLKAKNDAAVLEELVETTRFMLIGMYLHTAQECDSDDDIEAVKCPRCGELTLYSQEVLLPGQEDGMMCLSKKCI